MKQSKQPRAKKESPVITWEQEQFGAGMIKDCPASELPNNAVAEAFNMLLYDDWAEVRPAIVPYSYLRQPALAGRDNYQATKSGSIITKTQGDDFAQQDVDNYFVWPNGHRDLILAVINGNQVRVKYSDAEGPTTGTKPGSVCGAENARKLWHNSSRLLFAFFDNRLFYTNYLMQTWTQVYLRSSNETAYAPTTTYSKFDEYKGYLYLFNGNGLFVVDTKADPMEMWKANSLSPDNTIGEVAETAVYNHGRRYLNSCSRLTGTGARNRLTTSLRIQQQSGPNVSDITRDQRDYAEVYTQYSVTDSGAGTYEQLVCAATTRTLVEYIAVVNGSFRYSVNGSPFFNINVNLSSFTTFPEMAEYMQGQIRAMMPTFGSNSTVVWNGDHFIFDGGQEAGNTISYILGGISGTDIGDNTYLNGMDPATGGAGAIGDFQLSNIIGPLTLPVDGEHWTHYPVWSTKDISLKATIKEKFILNNEIPVAKAFDAYRDNADGHIHISAGGNGEFGIEDRGCEIEFADGTTDTLGPYVSATEMEGTGTLVAVAGQGAAIGGGDVMTARQDGDDVIVRTTGASFSATDVGRMVFWADGYYGYIIEFINANRVRVLSNATHVTQGLTYRPISRYYNDVVSDTILGDREVKHTLPNRFHEPFPTIDTGVVVDGWIFCVLRAENEFCYCNLPLTREYLGGYYRPDLQSHPTKQGVVEMEEFPDKVVIYCTNSTRFTPTNISMKVEEPAVGESIPVITGVNMLDPRIGLKDPGSIQPLKDGKQVIITSEPGVRIFDGKRYSEDFSLDSEGRGYIKEDLQKLQAAVATGYEEKLGYLVFGSDEAADN